MITGRDIRKKYIRNYPSAFCPGCGDGMVLNALSRAVENKDMNKDKITAVSGIGCAAWVPSPYWKVDTLHTTHGRAIPHALGVKVGNRELEVVVVAGDGDCAGIGGNHLIHAARSNLGITVLMINNGLYAMTGGQAGPTTDHGEVTLTTPFGNPAAGLDVAEVVKAAGGSHVARWTTYHMRELIKEIEHAFSTEGFSFIEILSQCPTRTGKKQGLSGVQMLEWYKENTSKDPESDKIFVGRLADETKPELSKDIYDQIRRCGGEPI